VPVQQQLVLMGTFFVSPDARAYHEGVVAKQVSESGSGIVAARGYDRLWCRSPRSSFT